MSTRSKQKAGDVNKDKGGGKGDDKGATAPITMELLAKRLEAIESITGMEERLSQRLISIEKSVEGIANIEKDVQKITVEQEEQKKSFNFLQNEMEKMKKKNDHLQNQYDDMNGMITGLMSHIGRLELDRQKVQDELRKREDYSKRECLLFEGIDEQKDENCTDKIMNIIQNKIGIKRDMKFQRVHRLGTPANGKKRPIIAKFLWYHDKQEVLRSAKNLKGTNYWIQEFYSETTANRRRALVPLMRFMQKKKGMKCTLVGDVLYAGNKRYTLETAKQLDFCQEAVTRSNDEVVAFSGQLCILSNFHKSNFTLDSTPFTSVEQCYQHDKADSKGQAIVMGKIINTTDPVQQKRLGGSLQLKPEDWNSFARMDLAVRAKFAQNKDMMDYLKSTAPKKLVEANAHDSTWACGLSISDPDILNPAKWKGDNQLGNILMTLRDE